MADQIPAQNPLAQQLHPSLRGLGSVAQLVTTSRLSIRWEANGDWFRTMDAGEVFIANIETLKADGLYYWVLHSEGWSAIQRIDGTEIYVRALRITEDDTPLTDDKLVPALRGLTGVVGLQTTTELSVRATAGGALKRVMETGEIIAADMATVTAVEKHYWVRHKAGWSALQRTDGTEVYVRVPLTVTVNPEAKPTPKIVTGLDLISKLVPSLQGLKATANLRVQMRLSIRKTANGDLIRVMRMGELVQANMATLRVNGNYYWVKHTEGWSAVQHIDGDEVFVADAGDIYVPGPDGPKVEEMPAYQALFEKHPIPIAQTNFWQYFGNTTFAHRYGYGYGYPKYAQGFHSGLDYGTSASDGLVSVRAGLHGTYKQTLMDAEGREWNHKIEVVTPHGYLVRYQHINPNTTFTKDDDITPDTVLGTVNRGWETNNDHLHLEVRYDNENWIVNPLAFMSPEMVAEITKTYDPEQPAQDLNYSNYYYFYITGRWKKWGTPLDQPIIQRGEDPEDPKSKGF